MVTGNVHSIETLGTLDGPGLRTVVFLQGCPLRCKFCHNVDCTIRDARAQEYTVDRLVSEVIKNKPYWKNYNATEETEAHGGVTFSGGEPTYQHEFLLAALKRLKEEGVHTAVDSCSVTAEEIMESLIPYVDLWMLSIKHMDEKEHINLTYASNRHIFHNIRALDTKLSSTKDPDPSSSRKIRVRFLVIPGITDSLEHTKQLGEFVKEIQNLELVEVLPYGSHGKYKWKELFGEYPLEHVRDATKQDVEKVVEDLTAMGLPVK